jgi:hypothetical protein
MRSRIRATVECLSGDDVDVEHHSGDDRILFASRLTGGGEEKTILLKRGEALRIGINLIIAGLRAML